VVVGDPLCAPFPRRPVQPADIDGGIDPATELPALFAARRLQVLVQSTTPEAAKAVLRAEARAAKDDRAGVVTALEEATTLDPKLVAAHLILATDYESRKDYDKAAERYRAVLAVSPDNALALNNLAYSLAVHKGQAGEAIGFAERAMTLTGGKSLEIADTLAWVQHLLGRDREAAEILQRIVKLAPARSPHAAAVFAAVESREEAATELREPCASIRS
jgi:Tfp pilus assembly protein PilF